MQRYLPSIFMPLCMTVGTHVGLANVNPRSLSGIATRASTSTISDNRDAIGRLARNKLPPTHSTNITPES